MNYKLIKTYPGSPLFEFILDDSEQDWSFKLEFVFWKPSNLFQTKFVLEDSRLWKYYNKKKAYFDKKFLELDNK